MIINIAVDGPAASGKGTLAKTLAMALSYDYLDTGSLYRAVAREAVKEGIDTQAVPLPESDIVKIAEKLQLPLIDESGLRTSEIAHIASKIAAIPNVRQALVDKQRHFATNPPSGKGAVLDGRDIGTVILPNASLKLFIDADLKVRAKRRFLELSATDPHLSQAQILADLTQRDARDKTRQTAPLVAAEDAHHIDTTEMTAQEVLQYALNLVKSL